MTGKVAIALRVLVVLLLSFAGAAGVQAQSTLVAPQVSDWEYSHIRCGTRVRGFTSEALAQADGVRLYYNSCGDASLVSPGSWGTLEERQFGSCGSTNRYPRFIMGVENINVRHPRVQFCAPHIIDSFALYRERTVSCPQGFKAAGDRKSTRLNSSHVRISYAVFCLKKKT